MSKPSEPRTEQANDPAGSIGQTIRNTAARRGLTAYAVAKLAEKRNYTEIREFLAGTRDLKLSTIEAICQGLGLVLIEAPQHEEPKHEPSETATVEPSGLHQQANGRRRPRRSTAND